MLARSGSPAPGERRADRSRSVRRSAVWAWLGWWAPIVFLWFPKQIVDDSWQITSSAAAVGQRVRDRDTALWWGLWIAYGVVGNYQDRVIINGIMGDDVPANQGVVPALDIAVAILRILAFAAWVPIIRGLSQAQTDLAHLDTADIRPSSATNDGSQPSDALALRVMHLQPRTYTVLGHS